jgi:Ca-activated chloride channel homolog
MTFNLLSSAWFFLLAIPLIAFYFLKLRRQRVEIPSLILWQQVLQDSRVNSPFQKFKRNLLLLLQLLLLAFLVFAAMDPIVSGKSKGLKLPILVDCSASMGTLEDGQTRLSLLKQKLFELIENKRSDQEIAIISFAKTAQKLCSFTNNRQVLNHAIRSLTVLDLESDLEPALKVTQALTKSGQFSEALLFTDGNFQDVPTFDLSFKLNYQLIGSQKMANVGISKLSARRAGSHSWMIFIQTNSSEAYKGTTTLEVFQDETKVAEDSFSSAEMKANKFSFRVDGTKNSLISVRLKVDDSDSLKSDNQAWLDLAVTRPLAVFIPDSLNSIHSVVSNIPGLQISNDPSKRFDLCISDNPADNSIDAKTHLSLAYIPQDLVQLIERKPQQSTIIDWQRSSQFLQHVNLNDILLMNSYQMITPHRSLEVEKKSYEILATGEKAPLILKKVLPHRQNYYCLFNPDQSTLPYKVAFPILLTNLINLSLLSSGLAEKEATRTGYLDELILSPKADYLFTTTDGETISGQTDEQGVISGLSVHKAGLYTLKQEKQLTEIHASVLSPLESSMKSIQAVQFNETSILVNEEEATTDRPLWSNLAFLAFLILILEWWFFQKKPSKILSLK